MLASNKGTHKNEGQHRAGRAIRYAIAPDKKQGMNSSDSTLWWGNRIEASAWTATMSAADPAHSTAIFQPQVFERMTRKTSGSTTYISTSTGRLQSTLMIDGPATTFWTSSKFENRRETV